MAINNKKYLDYAGLEKLKDLKAIVPHPTPIAKTEAAYKFALDDNGHVYSTSPLTAADLGLDTAMHFVGKSTTDPLSAAGATCADHTGAYVAGDVCIYLRDGETSFEEYVYTGTAWELLGDASSYVLKNFTITGGDHIKIDGGSDLSGTGLTISHKGFGTAKETNVIKSIDIDECGHVRSNKEITVMSGGGSTHDHSTSITIPANTYVTEVSHTDTKLSVSPTTAKVLKTIPGTFGNLDTTQITGVSGSTTASKATAQTAKDVAKPGSPVRYGTADVGTEVTGLAKRAATATTVGNANIASDATIIGNADVADPVVYGKANVGTAITVQDGKADVGTAVVYGKANVGTAVSVAKQATAQTKVGNADVGTAVRYGTANVGNEITVDAGKADVGAAVVYGTANVGDAVEVATIATAKSTFLTGVTASAPTTTIDESRTGGYDAAHQDVYNAYVEEAAETLVLSPVSFNFTASTTAPVLTPTTGDVHGVSGTVSITPAVAAPSTQKLTPAVASNRTVSFTPATAAPDTQTLTPAKAVSDSSTKIYGVSGSVDITPAVAAPSTQTLTPAVDSGRTKSIAPAVAAPSTQTLTPAVAATSTIYGAVASNTSIYGVTADQVSILPAKAAPNDQTIIPAVANGTITPYTFTDVTVPKAASATTVATGGISVGGDGDAVMTGLGTVVTEDVMTDATIIANATTGDVAVVADVTRTKNTEETFAGTTDEHICPAHTHILTTA